MEIQKVEKLNQLISRTDMNGNQKVDWLIDFIKNDKIIFLKDIIEDAQQVHSEYILEQLNSKLKDYETN